MPYFERDLLSDYKPDFMPDFMPDLMPDFKPVFKLDCQHEYKSYCQRDFQVDIEGYLIRKFHGKVETDFERYCKLDI